MNRGTWHGLGADKELSFLAGESLVCYLSLELCVSTRAGSSVQRWVFSKQHRGCGSNLNCCEKQPSSGWEPLVAL